MIRYNYHKHQILFKLGKDFQKPTITKMQLWGEEIHLTLPITVKTYGDESSSTIPPK